MAAGRIPTTANSPLTAKGDLFTYSTGSAKLAVGTNAQVLTADSTAATGLKWVAAGKVLQVIQGTTTTSVANSTTTYADTGLTATITPSSATSRILVMWSINYRRGAGNSLNGCNFKLLRDATSVMGNIMTVGWTNTDLNLIGQMATNYLDSPATTAATTYKVTFANDNASASVTVQQQSVISTMILIEVGA